MGLLTALLLVELAVGHVQTELDILAVLQTRDYTVAIDTVRFIWEVLPDQVFYPDSFGGQPGTVDSVVFTIPILWFPPSVRIYYRTGASPTRCETIPVLVQDSWYLLRAGTGEEPLIKFLRMPGIAERENPVHEQICVWPNPFVKGVWLQGVSTDLEILDGGGRVVCRLAPASRYWDGCDSRRQPVSPGTYIIPMGLGQAVRLVKIVTSQPAARSGSR
ncbi:MAG: hypothetical protein ABIK43_03050 [candidate division WOR-3 bacterium]